MALDFVPGYLSQMQVAPDSAAAPGTMAALAETMAYTLTPKYNTPEATVYVAPGTAVAMATRDFDHGVNGYYDFGDGGETNIIQSVFPSIIGSPFVPQTRLWSLLLENATNGTRISHYLTELGLDSTDPNGITKFNAKFAFDGTPTQPYTTLTGQGYVAPTTALSPAVAYKAKFSCNLGGSSTAFTGGEALTQIGATQAYQLPTGKRALDITQTFTLAGGATAGNNYTVDAMFGVVLFQGALSAAPTVTAGKYWTMTPFVGQPKGQTTMTFNMDTTTDINQATGYVKRVPTNRSCKMTLSQFGISTDIPQGTGGANIGTNSWAALWENRGLVLLEHDPDGQQQRVFRGWFYFDGHAVAPDPGKVIMQNVTFTHSDQTLRGVTTLGGSKLAYGGFSMGAP